MTLDKDQREVRRWFTDHLVTPLPELDEIGPALERARAYRGRFSGEMWKHPIAIEAVIFILADRGVAIREIARRVEMSPSAVALRTHPQRRLEVIQRAAEHKREMRRAR